MIRLGVMLLCWLPAVMVSAQADNLAIESGQWKVISNIKMNGAVAPPQVKLRCLTPEQASDVAKTFGPISSTINSDCARAEPETTGRNMKWHLQCKGQLDLDVFGDFNFDRADHYTATVISKGVMAGRVISDVKTELSGERIGDCPQ
ncbi:MAG TPA: DUF3617 family protein [Bradyrhizobium sp.]|jgi:hypothetical protein